MVFKIGVADMIDVQEPLLQIIPEHGPQTGQYITGVVLFG